MIITAFQWQDPNKGTPLQDPNKHEQEYREHTALKISQQTLCRDTDMFNTWSLKKKH